MRKIIIAGSSYFYKEVLEFKNKLEKNNLLSQKDELTIGILQGILEDMKEEGKE